MSDAEISDYALLSDCQSAALVSGSGSIDWLCMPRFDGPSIFGRLLDASAGYWSIAPDGEFDTRRRYAYDSLVLETQFATPTGLVTLPDALVVGAGGASPHELGSAGQHALIRSATCRAVVNERPPVVPSMSMEEVATDPTIGTNRRCSKSVTYTDRSRMPKGTTRRARNEPSWSGASRRDSCRSAATWA